MSGEQQERWSTGICGCLDDCENCCFTCWVPCVAYGLNVKDMHEGDAEESVPKHCFRFALLSMIGCWFCSYRKRTYLRTKYGLPESPCHDCCTHFWCNPCALCQEARELKHRKSLSAPLSGPPPVSIESKS